MYDNMGGPGEDSRWDVFEKLHSYIDSTFEFVWVPPQRRVGHNDSWTYDAQHRNENLNKTKIKSYGLVYHWQGSNPDLKPILFTAHQGLYLLKYYLLIY